MTNVRCPDCGFDGHAPGVKFCRNCGARLNLALIPLPPGTPGLAPGQQPGQSGITTHPTGIVKPWAGAGISWNRPPALEGTIVSVQGPNRVRKSMLGEALVSMFLGALKVPFAWLPMAGDHTIEVWNVCVADYQTGKQRDVCVLGTPIPVLSIGDDVALWGKESKGVLLMESGFKYATGSHIEIRR